MEPALPEVAETLHQLWSEEAVQSLLAVPDKETLPAEAATLKEVLLNSTLSGSGSFAACLIVAVAVAVPALTEMVAVRSFSSGLAS